MSHRHIVVLFGLMSISVGCWCETGPLSEESGEKAWIRKIHLLRHLLHCVSSVKKQCLCFENHKLVDKVGGVSATFLLYHHRQIFWCYAKNIGIMFYATVAMIVVLHQ